MGPPALNAGANQSQKIRSFVLLVLNESFVVELIFNAIFIQPITQDNKLP